ncbi:unnamed protein product [Vicia faba]|uniref:Uncharacterized protein n=1 Tax=Vicia faba TaxID=3906 RepID=A0AAV0Z902_VICFA|nr:unnamed protein product [Vicia faba]
MPPGALAVNTSRLKHDTRNKSTTSSMRQRTQAPSPPHTSAAPPPPHTTATPPLPHTTATPSSPLKAPTPPRPVFNQTVIAGEEEERDQTVSDEEEEATEQACAYGKRPLIRIVGNRLTPRSIVTGAIRKVLIKLYKGNFLQYSELKPENRREEKHAYFDLFKYFVQWEPCADAKIQDLFHKACGKRISNIFGKIRKKGEKPKWMGEKVYAYLLDGWKMDEFKESGQAGTSIVPSSVHPSSSDHHDDDSNGQSLDLEGMSDGC